jgi:hypothetical protein
MKFRELPWRRTLTELVLRGAISLVVCALVAACVGGVLSALAPNLRPKERSNYGDQAGPCKAEHCIAKTKGSGHHLANTRSEKRASQF